MDRALASGARGRWFESSRARCTEAPHLRGFRYFRISRRTRGLRHLETGLETMAPDTSLVAGPPYLDFSRINASTMVFVSASSGHPSRWDPALSIKPTSGNAR